MEVFQEAIQNWSNKMLGIIRGISMVLQRMGQMLWGTVPAWSGIRIGSSIVEKS